MTNQPVALIARIRSGQALKIVADSLQFPDFNRLSMVCPCAPFTPIARTGCGAIKAIRNMKIEEIWI